MTEEEWLACTDTRTMLVYLRGKASDRKLILFVLDCAYRNLLTLVNADHKKLYRSWDRYVEGLTSLDEVNGVYEAFTEGHDDEAPKPYDLAVWDADAFASNVSYRRDEVMAQVATLHDLFGPLPFRPVTISSTVLAWNDAVVVRLAQAAYEERHLPENTLDSSRLAILADALEEAGCTSDEILDHLRGPGPHVRGCWPIDLCLCKS